ncbi:MAG: flap endonuclease-1 [Methanobacteriota archaeon]
MGVQLGDLVAKQKVELERLGGKVIAIDALNSLYQFLSIIRQRDGELLRDARGRITSHLSGIFYRTANFVEEGIRPIYVFDGKSPLLKRLTVEQRRVARIKAEGEWKKALKEGMVKEAKKFAQRASRLDSFMIKQTQELLVHMGLPWVQAPGEGEAQAAHLVERGDAWAAASQDFDSLLFGAPTLIRNLAITGRRKLPGKDVYVEVCPEIIELRAVLGELGITREQLVDIGVLVGTDYNKGLKGIGPKKALELVKKHGSMEEIVKTEFGEKFEVDPLEVRDIFTRPNVTDDYQLKWDDPDPDAIKRFLCDEHDFSEDRVQSGIVKLTKGKAERGQARLEKWFG